MTEILSTSFAPNQARIELHLLKSGDTAAPSISRALQFGRQLYEATDLPETLGQRLHLAARPASYGSTQKLFDGIVQTLEFETAWQTWIRKSLRVSICHALRRLPDQAPVIAVAAAELTDGLRMLRVGGALCRHAITLAGFRPGAVLTLPSDLLPTLLLSGGLRSSSTIDCLWPLGLRVSGG